MSIAPVGTPPARSRLVADRSSRILRLDRSPYPRARLSPRCGAGRAAGPETRPLHPVVPVGQLETGVAAAWQSMAPGGLRLFVDLDLLTAAAAGQLWEITRHGLRYGAAELTA